MKADHEARKGDKGKENEAQEDLIKGTLGERVWAMLMHWLSSERSEKLFLVSILVLGFLLRLGHFWAVSRTAFLKITLIFAESDQYAFWQWAQMILAGDLLGRNTYHPYTGWMKDIAPLETWYRWYGGKEILQQAPLYPYWVAGWLALSKNSLKFVIFVQLVVGAVQPLVIFWLARRLFDVRVGLVAAALTAFYGPFIFHQGALLRDWLPPLLEPLALVALLKARATGRRLHWLLAGTALGVALLTKETILLFVPMALLWLFLEYRGAFRRAFASAGILLLGFLLALSPLVVRNGIVGAPLFTVSAGGAGTFIIGNAADTFPIGPNYAPSQGGILMRSDGRLWPAIRETLKTYHGDWLGFLKLQLLKLRGLVDPFEVPNNVSVSYGQEISPALWFTLRYGIIFPLGAAGFLLSLRAWRSHSLLAVYTLSVMGSVMFTVILARYRLVLVAPLIIYGAAGLVWLLEALRRKHRTNVRAYLGLLLGLALLQHFVLPIRILRDIPFYVLHPPEYFLSAQVYASEGRPDRAVAEMERLRDKASQNPSFAELGQQAGLYEGDFRAMWAGQLVNEGKREEAMRQVELVQAAYAQYFNRSSPNAVLGSLYLKLGEPRKARPFFERLLELESDRQRVEAIRRILERLDRLPR